MERSGWPVRYRPSTYHGVRIVSAVLLILLSCLSIFISPVAHAGSGEQAISADSFVDSIGIDTHMGYTNTPYGNYNAIKQSLQALGVRHIRDGGSANSTVNNEYNDLASIGIHSNLILGDANINLNPPPPGTAVGTSYPGCLNTPCYYIKDYLNIVKPAIDQVEGLNEYDAFNTSYPVTAEFRPYPNTPYGNTTWYRVLCDYMQQLHDTLRSDPNWSYLPITGPSFASYSASTYIANTCGDWSSKWVDSATLHDYVGSPMQPGIQANITNIGKAFPNVPFETTETGWNTTANAAHPISDTVQGKYIPRLLFEQINQGIKRTYTYELIDEGNDPNNSEANYGILHNDFSPKPAYTAEKNLISLLSDAGDPIQPGNLDYTISTTNTSVHHTLLQKRDGTFYLALWQDVASADSDVTTPVTLQFNTSIAQVDSYDIGASTTPTGSQSNPTTMTVNVPDKVLLLKITPTTLVPPAKGQNPPPPTPCPASGCPKPDLPPPPPPVGPLPDLTVTRVSYSGNPVVGQPLSFTATVKNIGYGPTPDGITIGVAFSGPGGLLCFEDQYSSSLAVGKSVDLSCNPGFTWTPKNAGPVTVTANVDDVSRIQETTKSNNTKSITFNVLATDDRTTDMQATAGNSAVFLNWGGTTAATGYTIKRTTIVPGGTPGPQLPEVTGSTAAAPATVDLTSEGTLDWGHWGLSSGSSFDHKANVTSQISNVSQVNAGYVDKFGSSTTFNWSDGTPTTSGSNNNGIYMGPYVPGSGFSFTVPADTQPRVLKVYAAARNFRASLSDGSAPDYNVSTDGSNTTQFTIIYNAASAGQKLTISLTDPSYNHINLLGATLAGPIALAPFTTIATHVKGTFYADTKVTPGTTYFYTASAITSSGQGSNSNLAGATPVPGTASIHPIVECVSNNGGGSYTAYFGYQNTGTAVLEIPYGPHNRFSPRTSDPLDRSQPTFFQPGRTPAFPHAAFSVDFDGNPLVWQLNGHTATASSSSQSCPQAQLIGSIQSQPASVNLTSEGTLDWAHWGLSTASDFNHKAGVTQQISNYTVVQAGYVGQYGKDSPAVSWSDGSPTASATTGNGIYLGPYVANAGFSITVPASTTPETLRIYLGTYQSQVSFHASLSDGIAADYSDSTLIDRVGSSQALYTLTFQASRPNQTLTVTFIDATFTGNISLQAATLAKAT
ncbi:CARDB domain-containing protein [Dictyobacter aurantiacus]|uniref:CARDB domain-containing protein n=1 Tax=Dictyobacter aurantiacus TaxID=1936993 RepID=A0A401Z7Z3_9CHLR|nr:CARDB domain-containing protein [Dictyobacter aurantiacus]GCE02974.1 hypothetical protein KDAU_03030 [Dictyobacter aurantiacus]